MTSVTSGDINKHEFNINELSQKTPDQAEQWALDRVTDLASARIALAEMARIIAALLNERRV